jgi:vacuolar iron transporter family protein
MATRGDIRRYLSNRQDEIDSAAQYRAMADGESDETVAQVYRDLAIVEERHATFWEGRLESAGHSPPPRRPSWRARVLSSIARRIGAGAVLPTIAEREMHDRNAYLTQPESSSTNMTAQEHTHTRVLGALLRRRSGASGAMLARVEGRHRSFGGNALRAAVLGANDGLCSNLALVMGVAGAAVSSRTMLLTGIAGLLAGAFSMALGEWVSVSSSRELAEREIAKEREELAIAPDDEREEIELIYRAKGVAREQAAELARQLMTDKTQALDVLTREELGIDPNDLGGSPYVAAGVSFVLFAVGAILPVLPFMFASGGHTVLASVVVSGAGLAAIGAAISLFTGKPVATSALRQVALGLLAAGATYVIGRLAGATLAG